MKERILIDESTLKSNNLKNTGGPRSRVRSEQISSAFFKGTGILSQNEKYCLSVPEEATDIEDWLVKIVKHTVWMNMDEAFRNIKVPDRKLLVISAGPVPEANAGTPVEMIRSALVLSKCSHNFFNPGSPSIFTRSRLHRNIELVKINTDEYYGMD